MSKRNEEKITEKQRYKEELHQLQIELVKLQRHIINKNEKILVILEGRDTAGKDGTIKRITQHLSPRETRIVALNKPSVKTTFTSMLSITGLLVTGPRKHSNWGMKSRLGLRTSTWMIARLISSG